MTSHEQPASPSAAVSDVASLIADATIEVIPLKGADDKVQQVPRSSTLTITCSPKFGLDRSLDHVEAAVRNGFAVVPHLAARMVADEAELRHFVRRVTSLGVDDLYVIAGDADEPIGAFSDAESILVALQEFDHGLRRIGVGCYPEGHPKIADDELLAALLRKQRYADYMVSQLCFDPATLVDWLAGARRVGVTLPLRIGLAAPLKTAKLAELALKIGVGPSLRFLTKQRGMVGNLVLGRRHAPEQLLFDMGPALGSVEQAIEGVHLFSFNQIGACVEWQQRVAAAGVSGH
jgi:methylenetetrahydrofolate reductase (NADPH)